MAAAPTAMLALLLLGDGRFPAGGHAHSGGVESAVAERRVHDEDTLEDHLRGRLATVGAVEAAMAAASTTHLGRAPDEAQRVATLALLDAEAGARIAVPLLRDVSRRQGRQLLRAATRCWPAPVLATVSAARPGGVHQAVALGAVGLAAGLTALDVARLAVHHALTTPAQAAVRLLGMDPLAVVAMTARLADTAERVAHEAAAVAPGPLSSLPARGAPLLDLAAVHHPLLPVRLFAS